MGRVKKKPVLALLCIVMSILTIIAMMPGMAYADGDNSMPALDVEKTTSNDVTVTIHAASGVFPEGTSVKITPVSFGTVKRAADKLLDAPVVDAVAVDISFVDQNGNEIEPADGKDVQISLHAGNSVNGDNHEVIHIKDDGTAENVDKVSKVTSESAKFTADHFSVYAIVGTGDESLRTETYEFYDGDKLVSSQKVKKGDNLAEPEIPKTQNGKIFTGWKDASDNSFNDFGTVGDIAENGKTIKLNAQYQDAVYLYYYDQYGNRIKSQAVAPNTTVKVEKDAPLIQVQPLTQCQDGWSTIKNGTKDVSGEYKMGTDSVDLYPILKEGYWVDFQTNSSSSIARQFIPKNATGKDAKVKKPETNPVKKGYVFDQWYTDKDLKIPYDFSKEVTQPLTLYAGYKPAKDTEYTVKYWIEYQKEPGSRVGDGTWDYKMIDEEVLKGTTGDKAKFHTKLVFSAPYNLSTDAYELDTDRTTADYNDPARPTIAADGSTVLNVYYKCKTYDLSIAVPKTDGTTQMLKYGDVKYSSDLANFWNAVFAIRPENELFDGAHRFVYKLGSGDGIEFVELASNLSTMQAQNIALGWQKYGGDNSYYKEYLETLHGKAPDGKLVVKNTSLRAAGDTRTYYLQKEDQFSSGWFGGVDATSEDFVGFSPLMINSDGNYCLFNDTDAQVWFRYPEDWFYSSNPKVKYGNYHVAKNADGTQHSYNGENDPIRIYYTRNSYPLNFHTDGGPEVKSQSVLYEDDLSQYNPSDYVVNKTTKKSGNQELVFGGWYMDQQLTEPFDFNSSTTMPAHELNLYAKWIPKTYTVTFDTGKGSHIDDVKDIEYGHTVAKPEDPKYDGHVFLGWTLDGKPYSFESGVTKDITLKAEWRSIKAWSVKYDLNGGSGTLPEDKNNYYEDAGVTAASADQIKAPEGKVFLGWKSSADDKIYYPNASVPMGFCGMKLTAQWGDAEKTTKLTYDFNFDKFGIKTDGDTSHTVNVLKNNSVIDLADISSLRKVPSGYKFDGWYLDKDCTKEASQKVLVDNLHENGNRVYAKWSKETEPTTPTTPTKPARPEEHTITFQPNNGQPTFTQTVPDGGQAVLPDEPSKKGYKFIGWYTDSALTKAYDFSTPVKSDLTLYAKWKKGKPTPKPAKKKVTGILLPKVIAKGKHTQVLTWTALKNVDGYFIYTNHCDEDMGRIPHPFKKVADYKASKARVYTKKHLTTYDNYKYYVAAYKIKHGKKVIVRNSVTVHSVCGNTSARSTNVKAVKASRHAVTLKKGKTYRIKASAYKVNKKRAFLDQTHCGLLRYLTADSKVATVDYNTGKIKAVKAGKTNIYVLGVNGIRDKVTVTVK